MKDVPGYMSLGAFLLGGGIVVITVNERRAVKQDILNEFVEKRVTSVHELPKLPDKPEELKGKVLHLHGEVVVTPPFPRDEDTGVEVRAGKLRMKRTVEMLQWKETRHEDKKTKTVSYTYNQEWAKSSLSTQDGRNPPFPKFSAEKEAGALEIAIDQSLRFLLSLNFVKRLSDFQRTTVEVANPTAMEQRNLMLLPDKSTLYTRDGNPNAPRIGDVRIMYEAVFPGVHTALGKYDTPAGRTASPEDKCELQPYTAKLKHSLHSEAEVLIPEEAHKLAKKGGSEMFTIPEWVSESAEAFVLTALPLEYASLYRGSEDKHDAFEHHRKDCVSKTNAMFMAGTLFSVIGAILMLSPIGVASETTMYLSGFTSGMGIAHATRKNAKAQLETSIQQREVHENKNGGSDVTI